MNKKYKYSFNNKFKMEKVTKHTRASKNGTAIICPKCKHVHIVDHFSWDALKCNHCNNIYSKDQFLIDNSLPSLAKNLRRKINFVLKVKNFIIIWEREPKQEIINKVKELLSEMPDYDLVQSVANCMKKLRKKFSVDIELIYYSIIKVVDKLYSDIEANDLPELRKQKLSKIKKVSKV
jgi:hypothetical protein